MFEKGDKVVYQWDSLKYYGCDGYEYGPGYNNLKQGDVLTVRYVFGNDVSRFFETVEFGDGDAYLEKYFITLLEYRRNKILKIKERICLK